MLPVLAALLALFVHEPPAAAPRAHGPVPAQAVGGAREQLVRILRASRRDGGPAFDACVAAAVAVGDDAVDALIEIYVQGRIRATPSGDEIEPLSPAQKSLLLQALTKLPYENARPALRSALRRADIDPDRRVALIELLGVSGESRDLPVMCEVAPRSGPGDASLTRDARTALREASAAILARDPRTWNALAGVVGVADDHAGRTLLQGVERRRDPRALVHLFELARARPSLAYDVTALIADCGNSADEDLDREAVSWMLEQLANAEREAARTLLRAVGALDDGQAVPNLIDLLGVEDPAVSESALAALQRISGLGFSANAAAWSTWYAGEVRWHERERPSCAGKLSSGSPALVTEALREYAGRRLHRASLAQEVAVVLGRSDPAMRRLACETLRQLGTTAASTALTDALDDADEDVAESAWQALRAISGLDLPRDADRVRELLASS